MSPFPIRPLNLSAFGYSKSSLQKLLHQALEEDGAQNDRTTRATVPRSLWAKGEIRAKQPGVLAGLPLVASIYALLDSRCRVMALRQEGREIKKDTQVAALSGPAQVLLSGERLSLNFLSRLSGVAARNAPIISSHVRVGSR